MTDISFVKFIPGWNGELLAVFCKGPREFKLNGCSLAQRIANMEAQKHDMSAERKVLEEMRDLYQKFLASTEIPAPDPGCVAEEVTDE